jgi:hypothetical protein
VLLRDTEGVNVRTAVIKVCNVNYDVSRHSNIYSLKQINKFYSELSIIVMMDSSRMKWDRRKKHTNM